MPIFHSYVCLPEGRFCRSTRKTGEHPLACKHVERGPRLIALAWEASIKIQREEDMDGDKKAQAHETLLSS